MPHRGRARGRAPLLRDHPERVAHPLHNRTARALRQEPRGNTDAGGRRGQREHTRLDVRDGALDPSSRAMQSLKRIPGSRPARLVTGGFNRRHRLMRRWGLAMTGLDDGYWVPTWSRRSGRGIGGCERSRTSTTIGTRTGSGGCTRRIGARSTRPCRCAGSGGALLLNDRTTVACDEQACTEWPASFFSSTGFMAAAQECAVRAFGLETGAWALWVDPARRNVRVRRYDVRMVVPLTWDKEDVTERAFVTRAFWHAAQ